MKALQVGLRLRQQTLIVRELALVALQLRLIDAVVDLRQEVALLDELALLERHLGKLAVDLSLYRDGVERTDGAELIQDDADVTGADGRRTDRLSGRRRAM